MSPPERLCHHSWCPRVSKFHQPQQPQLQVHSSCCWAVGFCICLLCKSCLGWVDIWASLTGWQCVAKCKIARLLSLTSRLGLFFRRRILSPTAKQPHLHSEMVLKHVCSRRIYVAPQESKLALRTQIWNCTGVRNFNPWQEGCCKIWSKSKAHPKAHEAQPKHSKYRKNTEEHLLVQALKKLLRLLGLAVDQEGMDLRPHRRLMVEQSKVATIC